MSRESNIRSLLKAVSWRVIATTTTIVIAYFIFGDIEPALKVGGIEFFAKFVVYYLHERAWTAIPLGTFSKRNREGGVA
ncbi:MAG: DUF2061 domain-containing protein [Verrucomicrobiales bacterium]